LTGQIPQLAVAATEEEEEEVYDEVEEKEEEESCWIFCELYYEARLHDHHVYFCLHLFTYFIPPLPLLLSVFIFIHRTYYLYTCVDFIKFNDCP
jgi:hypothetical protein